MKPKTTYKKDKKMSLKQMQKKVGGLIEVAYDDGKTQIICNEEGRLLGLEVNSEATKIIHKLVCNSWPMSPTLVGDVLVLTGKARLR